MGDAIGRTGGPHGSWWLCVALLGLLDAPVAGQERLPGSPGANALARDILKNPTYQKELLPAPDRPEREGRRKHVSAPGAFSRILLVAGLALLLILAATAAVAAFRRRTGTPQRAEVHAPEGAAAPPSVLMSEVERLAAAGRFGEAAHLLLLLAVVRMSAAKRTVAPASFTSRELVVVLPSGPEERLAFQELVERVELALFGGKPLQPEGFQRCLALYRRMLP